MSLLELLMSFRSLSYERLLMLLRDSTLPAEHRERVLGELTARNRALHNQWVQVCGGEYK